MKKNFKIKDGVVFELSSEALDIRGDYELFSVEFFPGKSSKLRIKWSTERYNQQIHMIFHSVKDFIVRGRDPEYPVDSGLTLAIAGFSDGIFCRTEEQFYVEPTQEMSYMSFIMDDASAIIVKADSACIQRV